MILLAVVSTAFLAATNSIYRGIHKQQGITNAADGNRKAFELLDKQVRYAQAINTPGTAADGNFYIEYQWSQSTGSLDAVTCTQWRLNPTTDVLQMRSWPDTTGATAHRVDHGRHRGRQQPVDDAALRAAARYEPGDRRAEPAVPGPVRQPRRQARQRERDHGRAAHRVEHVDRFRHRAPVGLPGGGTFMKSILRPLRLRIVRDEDRESGFAMFIALLLILVVAGMSVARRRPGAQREQADHDAAQDRRHR